METKQKNVWMKKIQIFAEIIIFCLGFVIILNSITKLVMPKYLFNTSYSSPETEMWENFNSLPKNSLDCLFVGSSHFYNGINPVVIYDQSGYTSFTLACSGTDMTTAYLVTNYALRTQSPQVVFLDAYTFFNDCFYNESIFNKSTDGMELSIEKLEAIEEWQKKDTTISTTYRLFPILDYHNRWEELEEIDFTYEELKENWYGFAPSLHYETVTHDSYAAGIGYELPISDVMMSYFTSIVDLCNANGIQLVLLGMPCDMWDSHLNDTVGKIAKQYGVGFIDYNSPEMYETLSLDLEKYFRDPNHLNMLGGTIFSARFAEYMQVLELETQHSPKVDQKWEENVIQWNVYYENQLIKMFEE